MLRKILPVIVVAMMMPLVAYANIIVDPGFENPGTIGSGKPVAAGVWSGDYSDIVSSSNGIDPFEGDQMLQFIYTEGTSACGSLMGDVYQLIDLSTASSINATGTATVSASAYFNRVDGENVDTKFGMTVFTYDNEAQLQLNQWTTRERDVIYSDDSPETWQDISLLFTIPIGTEFLLLRIYAYENVLNETVYPEFAGHYADNISLDIAAAPVPEPATMILFGTGLIGLASFSRRKRKK